jgi:hypothetical protein
MDDTHSFERAGLLRFAARICAAQLLADRGGNEEHMTCMTSHAYYNVSLLLPWRSSARATVMRVIKQDHASRTVIAPLGSFCQKAQLVSQSAFFSVARCRPGFYVTPADGPFGWVGVRLKAIFSLWRR